MVRVRYMHLSAYHLDQIRPACLVIQHLQTQVRPFGDEYQQILRIKVELNALAELAKQPLLFPPSGAAGLPSGGASPDER